MYIIKSALLAAVLLTSPAALAFDGNRQGFIMGFGAGFHVLKAGTYNYSGNTGSMPENGLATSFKAGAGITDQFALYFVRNDSWFRAYSSGFATKQSTFTVGMNGIGGTYFLAPTAPSGFFEAAAGVGYISAPFERGNIPTTGRGFMFGGGYEFEQNLLAEWTLLTTRIPITYPSVTVKSTSLQMTLNYLFY